MIVNSSSSKAQDKFYDFFLPNENEPVATHGAAAGERVKFVDDGDDDTEEG